MSRSLDAQPVILALMLMLAGCPIGLDERGGDEGLGGDDKDVQAPGIVACPVHDQWEPNPTGKQPSMIVWQSADAWTAYHRIDDAGLCAGEDDWYHYEVESLGYMEHYLYIRALIEDAGLCGGDCGQPVLPAGPQHAMTVEVYRAHDMQLLTSNTQDDGVLVINGPGGEEYARDLLIHVFSEAFAEYSYRLSVEIRNYDGEDECEC
jgi:hypothetical protein